MPLYVKTLRTGQNYIICSLFHLTFLTTGSIAITDKSCWNKTFRIPRMFHVLLVMEACVSNSGRSVEMQRESVMNFAARLHTSPTTVHTIGRCTEKVNGVTSTDKSRYLDNLDYAFRYHRLTAWFRKLRWESRPSL